MAARFRRHLTYSNVTATLALFLALTGGAYAARAGVFGSGGVLDQCIAKHGAERAIAKGGHCKHGEQLVAVNEHGRAGTTGSPGTTGAPGPTGDSGATGSTGAQGIQGVQGAAGTARAYGLVSATGGLTRQHNVVSVSQPNPGEYCITLASGIDLSTTGVNVTINANDSGQNPFGEWGPVGAQCAAGQIEVLTASYTGTSYIGANEGFFFSVP